MPSVSQTWVEADLKDTGGLSAPPIEGDWPFPFEPYPLQRKLMHEIYNGLEQGGLTIVESPTGTGKSQTLIASSCLWFEHHAQRIKQGFGDGLQAAPEADVKQSVKASKSSDDDELPDWVTDFVKKKEESVIEERRYAMKKKLEDTEAMFARLKVERDPSGSLKRSSERLTTGKKRATVVEYDSSPPDSGASDGEEDMIHDDGGETVATPGIIFSTRTHSQITQFIEELSNNPLGRKMRVTTLASRKYLCIHPVVRKIGNEQIQADTCSDLVGRYGTDGGKKDGTKGCSYLPKGKGCCNGQGAMVHSVLSQPRDIEDVVGLGKDRDSCPYFASRRSVPFAQIIALPHATLLHANTRRSLGLDLKGKVVLVDEAHNMLDMIRSLHSAHIRSSVLREGLETLKLYADKYDTRFGHHTSTMIATLEMTIKRLLTFCKRLARDGSEDEKVYSVANFLSEARLDSINLPKLLNFLRESNIKRKLLGFVTRLREQEEKTRGKATSSRYPFHEIEAFMQALDRRNGVRGIVAAKVVASQPPNTVLRFVLLNPAEPLHQLVSEARAVVLAGGTMSPISEITDLIEEAEVQSMNKNATVTGPLQVRHFAAGHVANHERIHLRLVSSMQGVKLTFGYQDRRHPAIVRGSGQLLLRVCQTTPDGVVVFFQSYSELASYCNAWEASGILKMITQYKAVFQEAAGTGVDATVRAYSEAIRNTYADPNAPISLQVNRQRGGVLLAVTGGKLSEGINFKDELARAVIVMGMPYPNLRSVEMREMLKHLEKKHRTQHPNATEKQMDAARSNYIQTLAMKAVNQSIGRAIRHGNDYAAVLLVDERFDRPAIHAHIPRWMLRQDSRLNARDGNDTVTELPQFFRRWAGCAKRT
eukprot:Clim_evm2s171 gene=Clim_evmTU2s171